MLNLGCERLPTPLKKGGGGSGSLPSPRSGYVTTITVFFFAHLLILQYPDHHQNLISSSLYYSGPVHKISSKSVHNVLSNVVHRQTNRQTDRQTDRQTNQRYQKHNLLCQGGKYHNTAEEQNQCLRNTKCTVIIWRSWVRTMEAGLPLPLLTHFSPYIVLLWSWQHAVLLFQWASNTRNRV